MKLVTSREREQDNDDNRTTLRGDQIKWRLPLENSIKQIAFAT